MVKREFLKIGDVVYSESGEEFIIIDRVSRSVYKLRGTKGDFEISVIRLRKRDISYPPSISLIGKKYCSKDGEVVRVICYESSTKVLVDIGGGLYYRTIHSLRNGKFSSRNRKRYTKDEDGNYLLFDTNNSGKVIVLETLGKGMILVQFVDTGNTKETSWGNLKKGVVFDGDWHKERPRGEVQSLDKTIAQFREVHGDRYIYEIEEDVHSLEKIPIICREHGLFFQAVHVHKSGSGCPRCGLYGYRSNSGGFLYIQKLHCGDEKYLKFGITNKNPEIRMGQITNGSYFEHKLIFVKFYEDGSLCREIETELKKVFKGCVDKEKLPRGFVETAQLEDLCKILEIIYDVERKKTQQQYRKKS